MSKAKPERPMPELTDHELLILMERAFENIKKEIECLHAGQDKIIENIQGNGKPGMKQEIVEMKDRLTDLEAWRGSIERVMYAFAITFVLFCGGVLWGILTDKIDIIVK